MNRIFETEYKEDLRKLEDAEEVKVIFSNNEILGVNPDDEGVDCVYVKGVLERVQ